MYLGFDFFSTNIRLEQVEKKNSDINIFLYHPAQR